jgi:hypothetical protein
MMDHVGSHYGITNIGATLGMRAAKLGWSAQDGAQRV